MKIDMGRKVVVVTEAGEKYVGDVPNTLPKYLNSGSDIDGKVTPEEYMSTCYRKGEPARLLNARVVLSQRSMNVAPPEAPGQQGRIVGANVFMILMPLDGHKKPAKEIYITMSSWMFPKDDNDVAQAYADFIAQADIAEKESSAREVLDLDTKMPTGRLRGGNG